MKKIDRGFFLKPILNTLNFLCCKKSISVGKNLCPVQVCYHGNQNNFSCGFQERPKMFLS